VKDAALEQKASRILQLLELEALRARYRLYEPQMRQLRRFSGRSLVVLDVIQSASSVSERQAQSQEARRLPWLPGIAARRLELAADGIWLRILSSSDRGPDELIVSIELNSRGEQVLSGTRRALSSAARSVRRSLSLSYFATALVLIGAVYADRVWQLGWRQGLIGIFATVAFIVVIQWLRRWRNDVSITGRDQDS
jgi:hypothetical protein